MKADLPLSNFLLNRIHTFLLILTATSIGINTPFKFELII